MSFVEDAGQILGDIASNRQNLEMLAENCHQVVPFVGAGLSLEFGYPSWGALLEELAHQAGLTGQVKERLAISAFEEAAEAVAKALPGVFDDTLKRSFDHEKLSRPLNRGAVRYLPSIGRGLVLTTNFDRVLEAAFEDGDKAFDEVLSGSQIREANQAIQLNKHFLLKLHGDYRISESRILTLSQFTREYGTPAPNEVNLELELPRVLGQVLAARPLLFLGCSLKIDRTLTIISRLATLTPGNLHFALLSDSENTAERRRQFDHWNIRPLFYPKGQYEKIDEFLACLAEACRSSLSRSEEPVSRRKKGAASYIQMLSEMERQSDAERRAQRASGTFARTTSASSDDEMVRINGFKLFYFRDAKKKSFADLTKEAGLNNKDLLRKIEKVNTTPGVLGLHCFQRCTRDTINKLEKALDCIGKLEAGHNDDFLSLYLQHYYVHKNNLNMLTTRVAGQFELAFPTKAVVFDFDGTLTIRKGDMTTWEKIWTTLGYDVNDSAELHGRFQRGEFTHETWCQITCDRFKERGFRQDQLKRVAKSMSLVAGTKDTIEQLRARGVKLYVLSGSIKEIIRTVLGKLCDHFEEIRANEIIFDSFGVISQISGTPFDFEHKATFLKRVYEDNHLSPMNVLFIGNSRNDVWASQSGVRTLCVNPHFTNPDDQLVWTDAIRKMKNLNEILRYVRA
jgi:HAD superfamily phosphoserine phosphatase-like hydrolase